MMRRGTAATIGLRRPTIHTPRPPRPHLLLDAVLRRVLEVVVALGVAATGGAQGAEAA